uniref:tryptophan synthase subunit alpha n=1 Tax=uncultured Corynebacterium sp. TaxID=159447 RepID=UPI0025CC8F32
VYLVAPSTTPERLDMTVHAGGGFIYAQSHMGVTGAQEDVSTDARGVVDRVRAATDLPVAVGLGVRNGDQAAAIAGYADGVIVGSALITAAGQGGGALGALAADLHDGVRR